MKINQITKQDKILAIPDIHFPDHDPKSLEIVKYIAKNDDWDQIVILGDMLDMQVLSDFNKSPDIVYTGMKKELDLGKDLLGFLRHYNPKAKIVYIQGNHEAREDRYLIKRAPELIGRVDYKKDLGLDKLGVVFVQDMYQTGMLGWTHGKYVRSHSSYSAKAHFDKYLMSMVHGHTHRLGEYYITNPITTYAVHELGCLIKFYPKYAEEKGCYNWQQGFGVVYVDQKTGWFMVVKFPIVNHTTIYKNKLLKG